MGGAQKFEYRPPGLRLASRPCTTEISVLLPRGGHSFLVEFCQIT
uniref:Uncharacterized protein n=1 Tax=Anguilla anguilla TaxID=7936 RepID=A0A0E9UJP0_ANGAN